MLPACNGKNAPTLTCGGERSFLLLRQIPQPGHVLCGWQRDMWEMRERQLARWEGDDRHFDGRRYPGQ
jgi:hypothetical protein